MSGNQNPRSPANRADIRRRAVRAGRSPAAPGMYHAVRFYDSDRSLARIVAEFLHEGLVQASPGIVVATREQHAEIVRELTERSLDVAGLQRSDDLVFLDAAETLSGFMIDGEPSPVKFKDQMCRVLERACRGRNDPTVRIFGQMVDVLWQKGERDAAIRLEVLWNQLARSRAFSLLCGYSIGNFYKDAEFEDVCGQHSHLVSADGTANQIVADASDGTRRSSETP